MVRARESQAMESTWNVAFVLCLYVAFLDLFGRLLGPAGIVEAFLAALAATTVTGLLFSGFAKKVSLK